MPPDCLGVTKARRHINGGAIGQRHHGANTGNRHQAPAHRIVTHDNRRATVQDADLFAQHSSTTSSGSTSAARSASFRSVP